MITAVTLNSIMMFAFSVCLLYSIGDIDKVANTPTLLPITEVYYQATKSKHATNVLVVMMILILFIAMFNIFASVSRLTWAFATDKGLPFSTFFARVSTYDQADVASTDSKTNWHTHMLGNRFTRSCKFQSMHSF